MYFNLSIDSNRKSGREFLTFYTFSSIITFSQPSKNLSLQKVKRRPYLMLKLKFFITPLILSLGFSVFSSQLTLSKMIKGKVLYIIAAKEPNNATVFALSKFNSALTLLKKNGYEVELKSFSQVNLILKELKRQKKNSVDYLVFAGHGTEEKIDFGESYLTTQSKIDNHTFDFLKKKAKIILFSCLTGNKTSNKKIGIADFLQKKSSRTVIAPIASLNHLSPSFRKSEIIWQADYQKVPIPMRIFSDSNEENYEPLLKRKVTKQDIKNSLFMENYLNNFFFDDGNANDLIKLMNQYKPSQDFYDFAFYFAASCEKITVLKTLYPKISNINLKSKVNNLAPLHIAAKKNNLENIVFLLSKKANIELKNKNGETALHLAVEKGNLEVTQYLLGKKSNIEAKEAFGFTPLHIASMYDYPEIIKLLLAKKAHINAKTKKGSTPLQIAAENGNFDAAKVLLQNKKINKEARNNAQETALYSAAKFDYSNIAELLLAYKADVEAKAKGHFTPLHIAADKGSLETAEVLINNKANIEARSKTGYTPLHVASENNHKDVVELLIARKANIECKERLGYTPLHLAAYYNHLDLVKTLLKNKANINSKLKSGYTPLHLAIQEDAKEVFYFLMNQKANIHAKIKKGSTPLHTSVSFKRLDFAKALLNKGANIECKIKSGHTPLHFAAEVGDLSLVKYLISKKANIEARTKKNHTPLHIAIYYKQLDVVKFLLKYKANKKAKDLNGKTSFDFARKIRDKRFYQALLS